MAETALEALSLPMYLLVPIIIIMIIITIIHYVKSVQIWIFFLVRIFSHSDEYGDLLRRYIFHIAIITTSTTTITVVITIIAISLFTLGKKNLFTLLKYKYVTKIIKKTNNKKRREKQLRLLKLSFIL